MTLRAAVTQSSAVAVRIRLISLLGALTTILPSRGAQAPRSQLRPCELPLAPTTDANTVCESWEPSQKPEVGRLMTPARPRPAAGIPAESQRSPGGGRRLPSDPSELMSATQRTQKLVSDASVPCQRPARAAQVHQAGLPVGRRKDPWSRLKAAAAADRAGFRALRHNRRTH